MQYIFNKQFLILGRWLLHLMTLTTLLLCSFIYQETLSYKSWCSAYSSCIQCLWIHKPVICGVLGKNGMPTRKLFDK